MPSRIKRVEQVFTPILILILPPFILFSVIFIPGCSEFVYNAGTAFFGQLGNYVASFFQVFSSIVILPTN